MKILMVSNDFLPNPGGVANHIFELSKALVQLDHEVRVLHFCYEPILPKAEEMDGVKIIRCWLTKKSANKTNRLAKFNRYITTVLKGSQAIKRQVKSFQPDVIHWHDYYHTSLAMFLVGFKGKKILTNHASGYLEQYAKGGWWHHYLKLLARPAQAIIGPSQELADKSKLVKETTCFIPNGVDIEKFKPLTDKEKIKQDYAAKDEFLLIAPRRLDPKNGLDFLIRALPFIAKSIPQIKLLIAGGGPEHLQEAYLQLAKDLNVSEQLIITGNLPYAKMPMIIASADLIIIPSLMEAVSLAALEAMACAIPIVASNVGGLPLIVDEKVGALTEPANPKSIAEAVIALYQLPKEELKAKGLAARERVLQAYTWQHAASQTIRVYENAKTN